VQEALIKLQLAALPKWAAAKMELEKKLLEWRHREELRKAKEEEREAIEIRQELERGMLGQRYQKIAADNAKRIASEEERRKEAARKAALAAMPSAGRFQSPAELWRQVQSAAMKTPELKVAEKNLAANERAAKALEKLKLGAARAG
jgi:hypothetical protein